MYGPHNIDSLLNEYYGKIYKLCLFFLGNEQEAEDAVQEIFAGVYKKLPSFRKEAHIYTWLRRIAVNHVLNRQRRKKLIRFFSLDDAETSFPDISDPAPDPALKLETLEMEQEKIRIMEQCLKKLSLLEKTAFYFHYYDGLKHKETAEIMNTTVTAVEALIHKAVTKLRRCVVLE